VSIVHKYKTASKAARKAKMKYRKKPVAINAIQWDGTLSGLRKIESVFPEMKVLSMSSHEERNEARNVRIGTLEGGHEVSSGDFIICGVKGEFYPCKPDIFEMTYEKTEDAPQNTSEEVDNNH
jgi:hypothetical protein